MRRPARPVRIRQGTDAWHEFRRAHVGSSDAPIVVGVSPWSSPYALWAEKTGLVEPSPGDWRMRVGSVLERTILRMYAEERGVRLRRGRVWESREVPWLAASLDAEAPGRLVEAKWTTSRTRFDGGPPPDVLAQVTHAMGVTGYRVADVAVLGPDGLEVHTVPFERAAWDALFEAEQAFWTHVAHQIPPDPDGSEATRRAILARYPEERRDILEGDPVLDDLVPQLLALRDERAKLDAVIEPLDNRIRERLADHAGARGPGWSITYTRAKDTVTPDWPAYALQLAEIVRSRLPDVDIQQPVQVRRGTRRLLVRRTTDD